MSDAKTVKAKLQAELDLVRAVREQVDLQSTLARAEARSSWDQLEQRLQLAQEEIDRIDEHAARPFHAIEEGSRALIDDIKHGYERLRRRR
jgi:predicted  nucleic acid-binding Zn-ribbon protein